MMIIAQNEKFMIRSWEQGDEESLVCNANNKKIWIQLTDLFPHPYTQKDAERWINHCGEENPSTDFAIVVGGKAVGSCGFKIRGGNNIITKEIGYWIGEEYRGQGIVPQAVQALIEYVFMTYNDTERIEAKVFERNENSPKVLKKLGFIYEGTLRNNTIKDGKIIGEGVYSLLREERKQSK